MVIIITSLFSLYSLFFEGFLALVVLNLIIYLAAFSLKKDKGFMLYVWELYKKYLLSGAKTPELAEKEKILIERSPAYCRVVPIGPVGLFTIRPYDIIVTNKRLILGWAAFPFARKMNFGIWSFWHPKVKGIENQIKIKEISLHDDKDLGPFVQMKLSGKIVGPVHWPFMVMKLYHEQAEKIYNIFTGPIRE